MLAFFLGFSNILQKASELLLGIFQRILPNYILKNLFHEAEDKAFYGKVLFNMTKRWVRPLVRFPALYISPI